MSLLSKLFGSSEAAFTEARALDECYLLDANATFIDLLTDFYTLPSWRSPNGIILRTLERPVRFKVIGEWNPYKFGERLELHDSQKLTAEKIERVKGHPILSMKITAWADEVEASAVLKSIGSFETWT